MYLQRAQEVLEIGLKNFKFIHEAINIFFQPIVSQFLPFYFFKTLFQMLHLMKKILKMVKENGGSVVILMSNNVFMLQISQHTQQEIIVISYQFQFFQPEFLLKRLAIISFCNFHDWDIWRIYRWIIPKLQTLSALKHEPYARAGMIKIMKNIQIQFRGFIWHILVLLF